jgi:dynein-related subfamily AAA family protein
MAEVVEVRGVEIHLAEPMKLPPVASLAERGFVGRQRELQLCKASWDVEDLPDSATGRRRPQLVQRQGSEPLNFRLEGPPGTGKNELVYQLARELEKDLYVVQGHEELTPEDLALVIVPDRDRGLAVDDNGTLRAERELPLVVRASPLATALLKGGLFFFDEINRVPERALSPLAPVLDGRRKIYSALTGLWIEPLDQLAGASFRFACALNPAYGQELPEYLAQRTLPRIQMKPAEVEDIVAIIRANVKVSQSMIDCFREWYGKEAVSLRDGRAPLSTRQAIQLLRYATKLSTLSEYREPDKERAAFDEACDAIIPGRTEAQA